MPSVNSAVDANAAKVFDAEKCWSSKELQPQDERQYLEQFVEKKAVSFGQTEIKCIAIHELMGILIELGLFGVFFPAAVSLKCPICSNIIKLNKAT